MKKRFLALLLAAAALAGCGSQGASQPGEASSESGASQPIKVELPADETVLGTVYDENVLYTDYRLYLDVSDDELLSQVRQEMALSCFLEQKMDSLGVPFEQEAFEAFAAEQYYNEMLSQPRLIDEIEAASTATGMMKDEMNLALFEGYRQSYDINCLGDFYAAEYLTAHPAEGEQTEEAAAARETESVNYANEQLSALGGEFQTSVTMLDSVTDLCTLNGQTIPMEDRHKTHTVLEIARARITTVDAILIGEGMAHEMREAGYEADLGDFETRFAEYLGTLREDEDFLSQYKSSFEKRGASLDEAFESMRRTVLTAAAMEEPYRAFINSQYEALDAQEKETMTADEYYAKRCEELYAKCIPVNPLG